MEFLFSKGFMKFYGLGLNIKETLSLCIKTEDGWKVKEGSFKFKLNCD
jgi:hypothetical protein